MARRILCLLPVALGLLAAACGDQTSFGPTARDDHTMAAASTSTDPLSKDGKGSVGGSVGGIKGKGK